MNPIPSPPGFQGNYIPSLKATHRHFEERKARPFFSILMTHVSIGTPFYKVAIRSLLNQSFLDWELIFVSSCRFAVEDVKKLRDDTGLRIRIHQDNHLKSRSQRFHKAVSEASGYFCAILDSDDYLHIEALRTVHWVLDQLPEYKAFVTSHEVIDVCGKRVGLNVATAYECTLSALSEGFKQKHLWGFRNEPRELPATALNSPYICEDYHFFSELANKNIQSLPIPNICYSYRIHDRQLTATSMTEVQYMTESLMKKNTIRRRDRGGIDIIGQLNSAALLTAKVAALFLPQSQR